MVNGLAINNSIDLPQMFARPKSSGFKNTDLLYYRINTIPIYPPVLFLRTFHIQVTGNRWWH